MALFESVLTLTLVAILLYFFRDWVQIIGQGLGLNIGSDAQLKRLSARIMQRGLGQRLLRDIERGVAAKRFTADDPLMSFGLTRSPSSFRMALRPSWTSPGSPTVQVFSTRWRNLQFSRK